MTQHLLPTQTSAVTQLPRNRPQGGGTVTQGFRTEALAHPPCSDHAAPSPASLRFPAVRPTGLPTDRASHSGGDYWKRLPVTHGAHRPGQFGLSGPSRRTSIPRIGKGKQAGWGGASLPLPSLLAPLEPHVRNPRPALR